MAAPKRVHIIGLVLVGLGAMAATILGIAWNAPAIAGEQLSLPRSAVFALNSDPQGAGPDELPALAARIPTPDGLNPVATTVERLSDPQAVESLTVARTKFNGANLTAITVLLVEGGTWDLDAALAVGGDRFAAQVTVDDSTAVLVQGSRLTTIEWSRPDGIIVQIVARGAMSTEDLLEYAVRVARDTA